MSNRMRGASRARGVTILVVPALIVTLTAALVGGASARSASGAPAGCPGLFRLEATPAAPPTTTLGVIDASGPGDVWSVGTTHPTSSTQRPVALHGDGATMSAVTVPGTGEATQTLTSVSAVRPGDAWLAGFTTAGLATGRPTLFHFDGTTVTSATVPALPGPSWIDTTVVSASASDDVWLAASLGRPDGPAVVLHRDGARWSAPQTVPAAQGSLDLLATGGSEAFLASVNGLFRFDGASWTPAPLPGGTTTAYDLSGRAGSVDVLYSRRDGTAAIAHWDGSTWTAVPTPPWAFVGRISTSPDGTLWATEQEQSRPPGIFANAQLYTALVGRYDGHRWLTTTYAPSSVRQFDRVTDLVALSSTDVRVVETHSEGAPSVPDRTGALCTPVLTPTGVVPARTVQAVPGASTLVLGRSDLPTSRTVTDDLGVLAPVTVAPGRGAALTYPGAGTYTASVSGGGTVTTAVAPEAYILKPDHSAYTVHFAQTPAPAGYRYVVQRRGPGETTFATVGLVPDATTTKVPASKPRGDYAFRVKLVRLADGVASGWSPTVTVTVV